MYIKFSLQYIFKRRVHISTSQVYSYVNIMSSYFSVLFVLQIVLFCNLSLPLDISPSRRKKVFKATSSPLNQTSIHQKTQTYFKLVPASTFRTMQSKNLLTSSFVAVPILTLPLLNALKDALVARSANRIEMMDLSALSMNVFPKTH